MRVSPIDKGLADLSVERISCGIGRTLLLRTYGLRQTILC